LASKAARAARAAPCGSRRDSGRSRLSAANGALTEAEALRSALLASAEAPSGEAPAKRAKVEGGAVRSGGTAGAAAAEAALSPREANATPRKRRAS